MRLTKKETDSIMDRLDEILDNYFHDAIFAVCVHRLSELKMTSEISIEDVQKIKSKLKGRIKINLQTQHD